MYSNTSPEKVNIHYPDVNRQQNLYPVVNQENTSPTRSPCASRTLIIVINKIFYFLAFTYFFRFLRLR
jgi:hypothetical protein